MENTISCLYQFMDSQKDIGACAPRLLLPDGRIQKSCRELPTFKNLFFEFSGIKRSVGWKMRHFNYEETREVEQPMGSCLMIRKKVFDKIDGMNERYPIFMNDVDLCYRIKRAEYKIYFLSEANAVHYLGSSTRQVKRKMILEEHRSMYRYLRDHFVGQGFSLANLLLTLYGTLLLVGAFYRILFSRCRFNRVIGHSETQLFSKVGKT